MTKLKPGDCITCKVKNNVIVSPYSGDHDELRSFEIVGNDLYGYYLYIPSYLYIRNSKLVDQDTCDFLRIDTKYIGEQIVYIQESLICKITSVVDGYACIKCKEFYRMSEPNQPDGTLLCWTCKTYPYH